MALSFYSVEKDEYFDEVVMTKESRDAPVRIRELGNVPIDRLPTPPNRVAESLSTEDRSNCKMAQESSDAVVTNVVAGTPINLVSDV
jgi:hypothetical protein